MLATLAAPDPSEYNASVMSCRQPLHTKDCHLITYQTDSISWLATSMSNSRYCVVRMCYL